MRKIAVVVVHGIGSGTGKERYAFSEALRKNAKMLLPYGEDPVWEEANWEKLNDDFDAIIERVLKGICAHYICETKKRIAQQEVIAKTDSCKASKRGIVRWFADQWSQICMLALKAKLMLLEPAEKHLPSIVDAAIDLPLYLQEPKGGEIRMVVHEAIDAAMKRADKVVLVGHSLGSVIAYDVAVEELSKNGYRRLAALVTMGSPLNWVAELRKSGSMGKWALPPTGMLPWINFWDPADPVPEHKELDDKVFRGVKNVKVESGQDIYAHCAYWNNKSVAHKISSMLKGEFSLG